MASDDVLCKGLNTPMDEEAILNNDVSQWPQVDLGVSQEIGSPRVARCHAANNPFFTFLISDVGLPSR
jgi:hypothetical protein